MADCDNELRRRGATTQLFFQVSTVPDGTVGIGDRQIATGVYYVYTAFDVSADRTRTIGSRTRSRGIGSMSRTKTGGATDRSGGIGSNPRIRYIGDS